MYWSRIGREQPAQDAGAGATLPSTDHVSLPGAEHKAIQYRNQGKVNINLVVFRI
jgi:hypothetical protein